MTAGTKHSGRPRILIVDDDPIVARSLARGLRPVAEVAVELDPVLALERVGGGERFDMIVCDVAMPRLTGPELFGRVVALAPALEGAFVFVSGGMAAQVEKRLLSTGRPCLQKPVSMTVLKELVAQLTPRSE